MTKSKNRGNRESRKPQQELVLVPDLGNLSMPRKENRAAARYVASVGLLWDRRRADRKARKKALTHQDVAAADPRRHHLDKAVREQMLGAMAGWSFDHEEKAFIADGSAGTGVTPEQLEEMLDAVIDLGPDTIVLRVSGLSPTETSRVRRYLGRGSQLIVKISQQEQLV